MYAMNGGDVGIRSSDMSGPRAALGAVGRATVGFDLFSNPSTNNQKVQ